ncbi:MAG TPA: decaprenyl-phosphate phosphoribosyltransferase [Chloroflexota bacterium]|nr:decaprenyl-phosphate phosphoribosyltransferase [Chloroflexota bacterium]
MTGMRPRDFIQTARPAQWLKNAFVLAPVVFARSLDDPDALWRAVVAAALFSLVASGVYFLNDAGDAPRDRQHPTNRHRPIAAGRIGRRTGAAVGLLLMAAGIAIAGPVAIGLAATLGAYSGLNLLYSLYLKRFALVDIVVISVGFVLRAVAGALAIDVMISVWLLVCTFFVAMLIAAGKRRAELVYAGDGPSATRPSLDQSSVRFYDTLLSGAAGATLVCYALYTVSPEAASNFGGKGLILTMPFVVYGVWHYVQMIHSDESVENPTTAVMRSRGVQVAVLGWGALVVAIIYGFGADLGGFIE